MILLLCIRNLKKIKNLRIETELFGIKKIVLYKKYASHPIIHPQKILWTLVEKENFDFSDYEYSKAYKIFQ